MTAITKLSAGGTATGHGSNRSSSSSTAAATARGAPCSPPPAEQACRDTEAGGDVVLRAMGGGYLTVTTLSTLSRALLLYTMKQTAADRSQRLPHDGHQPSRDNVDDQFGPAREVAELLSLLVSLFRLGSPSSQVREHCALHTGPLLPG